MLFCADCAYAGHCDRACGLCDDGFKPTLEPTPNASFAMLCNDMYANCTGWASHAGWCDEYFCADCAYAGLCDSACGLCDGEV